MIKRVIAATVLAALLLVGFTSAGASAPGSPSDPLISLEYILNTYYPALLSDCKNLTDNAFDALFGQAADEADQIYGDALLRLGSLEGYDFAGALTAVGLPAGKTAELVSGSMLIPAVGSASLQITQGAVVNVSTGSEVPSGSLLAVNQRYFCAEDTLAVFTALSDTICLIDGYYKTSGSVIVNPFSDVGFTDWYFAAVNFARENSLFTGTTSATFSPQASMTRGMFVTVLYRLAGKPPIAGISVFPDVTVPAEYYYDAVIWASGNGIVTGYDDGRFHPDVQISREQMAVIMHRYAAYAGYGTVPANTAAYDAFPDKDSVSPFAVEAMKWAVSTRLISGSDGYLLPNNTATRAQVAQIIMNFCRNIAGM